MKTVLVVYRNEKADLSKIRRMKRYAFNSSSELKEGDMIESKDYDTNMQVVKVLDRNYKYYNAQTGELSDEFNSTAQWEIRELAIREESEEIVYGKIIKE